MVRSIAPQYMLGNEVNPVKGAAHISNSRNELIMYKVLEENFDNADFVIVPNGPHFPARLSDHGPRYSELDGRELEFKTEARQGYRYLYWHFVTSLMRAIKWEKATLESIKAKLIWSTPGAYCRKIMLKRLGQSLGYYDMNDRDFEEGLFEGGDENDEDDEDDEDDKYDEDGD
ncbi:hypothetical protein MMC31_000053 [Peltigera leucophlebia]|nr:hypothetical protein [Peltigera leucophlebia]